MTKVIVILESVGCAIDMVTLEVYALNADGTIDKTNHTNLMNIEPDSDWFVSLGVNDYDFLLADEYLIDGNRANIISIIKENNPTEEQVWDLINLTSSKQIYLNNYSITKIKPCPKPNTSI